MKNKINLLLATTIWMVVFSNNLSASIIIGNAYIDSEKDTIVTNDNIIGLIRYEAATRTITLQDASITMPYSFLRGSAVEHSLVAHLVRSQNSSEMHTMRTLSGAK